MTKNKQIHQLQQFLEKEDETISENIIWICCKINNHEIDEIYYIILGQFSNS